MCRGFIAVLLVFPAVSLDNEVIVQQEEAVNWGNG
jgi:hypothetical protein